MAPPAVTVVPRKLIDPSKQGKFSVKIGDSLKDVSNNGKGIACLKYNHKPAPSLTNGRDSRLKSRPGELGNEVALEITPNDAADPPVTFTGVQTPSRKTECVLIYDPNTGTFNLEKLASVFTLNLESPGGSQHAPLSLPKHNPDLSDEDQDSSEVASDGDITKVDKENPFDFRHFLNNKFEVPVSSSMTKGDKRRKERLEKFQEEPSDPASPEEEAEDTRGDIIIEDSGVAPPPKSAAPPRQKAAPHIKPPRQRQQKALAKKITAGNAGPISLSTASKQDTPSLNQPSPTLQTILPISGTKRPRKEPASHETSSESDADDESEESEEEETEFASELIVEGEGEDDRNNRSRSTTAGLGASWRGGNATRGGPISLSRNNMDLDDQSDEDDEPSHPHHQPSPYQQPISLSVLGGGRRGLDQDDEESSDEDEDEEPRLSRHFPQMVSHSAPTPQPAAACHDDGGADDDEDEEGEEFDLVQELENALENQDDIPPPPPHSLTTGGPMSLGRGNDDEEESSSEEE